MSVNNDPCNRIEFVKIAFPAPVKIAECIVVLRLNIPSYKRVRTFAD